MTSRSLSPAVLLDALRAPGTVLLDAAQPDADTGETYGRLFTAPLETLVARRPDEVRPLLAALDARTAAGRHVAGFLAYEAGYALDPALASIACEAADPTPLAWFGVYDAPVRVPPEGIESALVEAGAFRLGTPRFAFTPQTHAGRVARIRALVRAGDVYQVNLTAPFRFTFSGDPVALYAALRQRQRTPYAAWLNTGAAHVLSLSPELFFRTQGRTITARPMKGTVRRGTDAAEDDALAAWLAADEKNRAENLMIVDLLRNDLARVSEPGSVRVPRLFEAERYETVTQLTSTVEARLDEDAGLADVFGALFPCGSITGAPKLRAMQRIASLEPSPRGVYCGAIGYAAPGGEATFNVAIRTVVLSGSTTGARREHEKCEGMYGAGGGIVWDSNAETEYDEVLLKARVLTELVPS